MILAALVITGAAFYVIQIKGYSGLGKSRRGGETGRILVIKDAISGKNYGKWPLEESGEFSVEFIHSVNQGPVRETYKAEGKLIRPCSVRFSSFGAGMQSDLEEGQTLSRDGNALVISGFNASFKKLNYIVGTVSDHLLIINSKLVSLRDLCGRNAHITIYLE